MGGEAGHEGGHVAALLAPQHAHVLSLGGDGEVRAAHGDGGGLLPVGRRGVALGGENKKLCLREAPP